MVLSLSDWYHEEMSVLIPKFINKANPTGAEPVPQNALLNETQNLKVAIQPGKTYLFHVVNIGAFAGQYVSQLMTASRCSHKESTKAFAALVRRT